MLQVPLCNDITRKRLLSLVTAIDCYGNDMSEKVQILSTSVQNFASIAPLVRKISRVIKYRTKKHHVDTDRVIILAYTCMRTETSFHLMYKMAICRAYKKLRGRSQISLSRTLALRAISSPKSMSKFVVHNDSAHLN